MLVLAPMMLSLSAVGVFFKLFYDPTLGFISRFISLFTSDTFVILSTPARATVAIVVADAWMWSPFVMLLVLAGLVSVPKYLIRGRRDRSGRTVAAIPHDHLSLHSKPAVAGAAVPHDRNIQDIRRRLSSSPKAARARRRKPCRSTYIRLAFQFFQTSQASALGYIMLFAVIVLTSLYLYAIQSAARSRSMSKTRTHR